MFFVCLIFGYLLVGWIVVTAILGIIKMVDCDITAFYDEVDVIVCFSLCVLCWPLVTIVFLLVCIFTGMWKLSKILIRRND